MNISTPVKTVFAGILTVIFAAPATAQPGIESFLEHRAYMQSEPDELYFFEDDRKMVVSYNNERIVRICADESRVVTPLRISYDDKTATVAPGDCVRVEAMEVYLEPDENLDANTFLKAEVQTLN